MTTEETIKKMQAVKAYMISGNPIWSVTEMGEALDMAIEALKQPKIIRCKDCINQGMNDCPMWEGMITEDYMWCCEGEKK